MADFIERNLSPLVAVSSSEDAIVIANNNQLPSFAHLVAPFGLPVRGSVNLRDTLAQATPCYSYNVRFRSLKDINKFKAEKLSASLLVPIPIVKSGWVIDLPQFIASGEGIILEGIYVVSTTNNDPIATFNTLSNQSLPKIYEEGYIDPNFLKYYLLLHDSRSQAVVDPEQTLTLMKKTFGLGCYLISLTGKEDLKPHNGYYDYWESNFKQQTNLNNILLSKLSNDLLLHQNDETRFNSPFGLALSKSDIAKLESFVNDFTTHSLLPFMERNVQNLNQIVASTKKGITGRFFSAGKSFFGGNSNNTVAAPQRGTLISSSGKLIFTVKSNESLQRRLGDLSFMLRDYRFAYTTYDGVRKEFQSNEKALKHYAGIQEMLGLCVLMMEGGGKGSVESYLESAIDSYRLSDELLFETRSTIMFYQMLKHKEQHRDAPALLNKMTGEESDFRSALFLEQSALCFLTTCPIMHRKYAFFLVLAGSRYTKCNEREHASRCYLNALRVYETHGWSLIEDHIDFALSRQMIYLGDLVEGVNFLSKVFRPSRQSASQQDQYLLDFFAVYGQLKVLNVKEDMDRILPVNLPVFIDKSTSISLSRNAPNLSTVTNSDETWDTMEKELVEGGFNKGRAINRGNRVIAVKHDLNIVTCAVGESVFVHLEIFNPLQVQLVLNNISVRCVHGDIPASFEGFDDGDRSNLILVERDGFTIENIPDFILQPNENAKIQITIIPKETGDINILGVVYLIGGLIPTFKNLCNDKIVPLVYPKLRVTPPMPVLDVEFISFPEAILSGEVVRAILVIRNNGNRGLKNLKMKVSHPSFLHIGASLEVDQKPYDPSQSLEEKTTIQNGLHDISISTIKLPTESNTESADGLLSPDATLKIPIFLRGDRMGKHVFRFLFGYQSEGADSSTNFRTLKHTQNINVTPSLRINAFTRPSARILNEFTLGIEIENMQVTSVFLNQISALSSKWIVKPITGRTLSNYDRELKPKSTIYMYFRFSRVESNIPQNQLPESIVSNAIERVVLADENIAIKPYPLPCHISSLSHGVYSYSNINGPLQNFSLRSRTQWRMTSLSSTYNGLPPDRIRKLFTLYFSDDVDLTLFWNIPNTFGEDRVGHQYIMGVNLSLQSPLNELQLKFGNGKNLDGVQSKALYAATVREKKELTATLLKSRAKEVSPLRILLRSVDDFYHDFSISKDCVVAIPVLISNGSSTYSVSFTLELVSFDIKSSVTSKPAYPSSISWAGSASCDGSLKPEEEVTVTVYCSFAKPGIYDLNKWKLSVQVDQGQLFGKENFGKNVDIGQGAYVQTPNLSQLITVHSEKK